MNMFGDAKLRDFAEQQVGKTNNVLFEQKNKVGLWEGYSTNFVKVCVESNADLNNQILPVHIHGADGVKCLGTILN